MLISNATFKEESASITIKNSTTPIVNGIRRAMLRDLPMLAVSQVQITTNNTPMPDDMLSHRIGLVPVYIEGTLSANDIAKLQLKIVKFGPRELYSDDILCEPDVVRIVKGIYICPLSPDQTIELTGSFKIGTGAEHARFQRCVAPAYSIRHEGVTGAECFCSVTPADSYCDRCGNHKPCLATQQRDKIHILHYETIGGISPKELITSSLQVLISKLQNIHTKLETLESID